MNINEIGKFDKLPLGKIKPEGWLKRQLQLQARGLTGHLDEIFEDVSKSSAWLGGNGEAWERGPYYLDGLISLAYLLDDMVLLEKSNRWIEKILLSQEANGNFGPKRLNDWWPKVQALKALTSYAEASGDKQVLGFMRNFFKFQFNSLDEQPPYMWASARALDELVPLLYFYANAKDENLCQELVEKLKTYSYDWFGFYGNFKYKKTAKKYLSKSIINFVRKVGAKKDYAEKHGTEPLTPMSCKKILRRNKIRTLKKMMLLHGVNNAMAVKYPVLFNEFFPDAKLLELSKKAVTDLLKHHGTAVGVFTSDEPLDGISPTKGIELCTVVEWMYSLETLLQKTGDCFYADLLELATFNALPATIDKSFTSHQYLQQLNQISATVAKREFFNVDDDATTFGLEPNFGCCTVNMHQGFPKFCENLCYKKENELAMLLYSPCKISADLQDGNVVLTETTDYPFKSTVKITVDASTTQSETLLIFRVPKHTSAVLSVNGAQLSKADKGFIACRKQLVAGDVIELKFDMPLVIVDNLDKSISFRKGSLLMATKLNYKQSIIKSNAKFCDSEYIPTTQWRTAPIVLKKGLSILSEVENDVPEMPFDEERPAIEIIYEAKYIKNWEEKNNSAGDIPVKPKFAEGVFKRALVPYGSTLLRIAHHPKYSQKK